MNQNFDNCMIMLLAHEGGFVDHPDDPGGMTNLGVTKAVYDEFCTNAEVRINFIFDA
ncbi:glycosyl hydrolase 108 family protein [Alphaproteobacteria bacterium LSUCC0744]